MKAKSDGVGDTSQSDAAAVIKAKEGGDHGKGKTNGVGDDPGQGGEDDGNGEDEDDNARRIQEEEENRQREIALVQEFIEETKRRNAWKESLRAANLAAADNRPEEADLRKLDSSLKKNTAFIRKVKNFTGTQADALKREMGGLNLTKYVGEVAAAVVEAKLKMTDLQSAVEICSALHQKYSEFAPSLLEAWQKILVFKKDDKISNPSKLRVDLRFYAELVTVGVFSLKEGLPLLGQALTFLVNSDKEAHIHVALVMAFCKHCGDDYAGLLPRRIREPADKHCYQVPESTLLTPEKRKGVVGLLREYYQSLCRHLQSEHREWQGVERTNKRILMTKGEVHAERRQRAEALAASCAKLTASAEQLSDALDEDMPELKEAEKDELEEEAELLEKATAEGGEASLLGELWEDEEAKSFYETLVDIKSIIPAILYKDTQAVSSPEGDKDQKTEKEAKAEKGNKGSSSAESAARAAEAELLGDDFEEDLAMALAEEVAPPTIEDDPEDGESQSVSAKMQLDAFLARLPNCVSRDLIDSAAVDFCMTLNNKINRKKLIKTLFSVHRNRQDLLPFYARLAASLDPVMPEVSQGLAQYLKQEFKWQVRKKDQMKVESKMKVCHFIGEMVKFGMFPKSEALFCLKMLLFDFTHHNIEMACALMEACGRFLFRSTDSHQRTKIYLEQMKRKKMALSLDARHAMMIENALSVVNPPEVQAYTKEALPPMQEYIQKLIFHDLCKTTTEKVLKQVRKLNWADDETATFAVFCLSSVWNVKYYNIRYAASLLAGLVPYHDWIGPRIVDSILEDIRLHMEVNDAKFSQRRIAVVKYLSELYNYRLVDSAIIFKVLYSLISYMTGTKVDDPMAFMDPPEHMLRIRLICVILDTCGIYFNTGGSKKKLDYYLTYFQRYYWRKKTSAYWGSGDDKIEEEEESESKSPPKKGSTSLKKDELLSRFPIAVTNLVEETIANLRPKLKLFKSIVEAEEAGEKVDKEMRKALKDKAPDLTSVYFQEDDAEDEQAKSSRGLGAIAEEAEDDEDDEDPELAEYDEAEEEDDDDGDEVGEERHSSQRSGSRGASAMGPEDLSQNDLSQTDRMSEEEEEESDLDEEQDPDASFHELDMVPSAPKLLQCDEDDDFLAALDKVVNDSVAESRAAASVPRGQQVNIVAPMSTNRHKKNAVFDPFQDRSDSPEVDNNIQFKVLLRKGNKPAYKDLAVPADSDLAINLQRQEAADRREKERVKQLTLEINERQEEEDLNEAIAALQRPVGVPGHQQQHQQQRRGGGRGGGHHHQRGVPDTDAIFGTRRPTANR